MQQQQQQFIVVAAAAAALATLLYSNSVWLLGEHCESHLLEVCLVGLVTAARLADNKQLDVVSLSTPRRGGGA